MRLFRMGVICLACFLAVATVYANDGLEMSGPEAVYPRQTFEIVLMLDRADITKISFELNSDWENLQLQAMWTDPDSGWECDQDMHGHVLWRPGPGTGDEKVVCRLRLQVLTPQDGVRIWLAVTNIVIWAGDTSWQIEDILWERISGPIISDNSYLASLRLSDGVLSPEFSPYQLEYTATVPYFVAQVSVTAMAMDGGASVQVDSPVLEYGKTSDVTITVTAEDQSVRVYTIAVTREDSPDRVPSGNCDLQILEVTDYKLSPGFSPENTAYVLWLPYETTGVEITATPADSKATVTIVGNKGFKAGRDNPVYVTCTAEDGTEKIYVITAKRAEAYLPQPSETAAVHAPTVTGTVHAAASDVPVWVYVVVAVAAVTGCSAVGILIADRKK